MYRFRHATIRLTASTLLVVFLSALLGPVAALAQRLPHQEAAGHLHLPSMPQAHHHHAEDQDESQADDHDDDYHAPVARHAPASHHGHHAYTNDDDQQLSSLSPLLKPLASDAAPAVLALLPAQSFAFRSFQAWDRQQAVGLVPPERLKPKIPDLRIFFGSLII